MYEIFFLSHMTFDLYAYHSHKWSLAAGAKCKFFAKALKRSDLSDPSGPLSASITTKEASDASVTV